MTIAAAGKKAKEEETPEKDPAAASSGDAPPKPLLAICGPKFAEKTGNAYAAAMNRIANNSYCSTPAGPPPPKHHAVPLSVPPTAPPTMPPPTMPPPTISKAAAKAAVTHALFTNICMYVCIDNIFRQNNINILVPECQ